MGISLYKLVSIFIGGVFVYLVSEVFLQAVQENTRRYDWTGKITTTKGVIYEFGSGDIVRGKY